MLLAPRSLGTRTVAKAPGGVTSPRLGALVLGCLLFGPAAAAQQVWPIPLPEESEDQPAEQQPTDQPAQPAPSTPAPSEPAPPAEEPTYSFGSDVISSYAVRQGQIGIGAGVVPSFNLTGTLQLTPIAPAGTGTFVLALSPQFSYFVIDGVEVGGFIGPVLRHRVRAGAAIPLTPELDGSVGAFAAYHYPVTDRVLLIGTVGGGPLLGASAGPAVPPATGINLTVVGGAQAFARGGAGYMFNRSFQVRVEGEVSGVGDLEYNTGAASVAISGMTNTGVRLSVHGYF